jgi:hypothetical protein
MYSQNIKISLEKDIVNALLKRLKYRSLEEYINEKLKQDILK